MTDNDLTIIGETDFRNQRKRFGIKRADRQRHFYVVGQTGMGKSTLLLNLVTQDVKAGNGLALIDPHGDLVESLLDLIPRERIEDVVYLNATDFDYPIGLNVLEVSRHNHRHFVASGLVGVFKKIWRDSWGPRLEYVLRNAVLALQEVKGSTLLSIPRLLTDEQYRATVLRDVADPFLRQFWQVEYELYPKVFRTETISPIQNKIGQFLSVSIMRNILGQRRSSVDMREVMDSGKILLVNLSKGVLGEDNAGLLGSLVVNRIAQAAMSRANGHSSTRKPFYVYIDEFQDFAAEDFATILSEMRKYGLHLILAHQHLSQLPLLLRSAIFGNVGTLVAFRTGAEDGEYLSREYLPAFRTGDLSGLSAFQACVRLSIDGKTSDPFTMISLPPPTAGASHRTEIIRYSRLQYGVPRATVERDVESQMLDLTAFP